MDYQVEDLVKGVNRLPTINTVTYEVIRLCANKETPIPQLVKIISSDQSLTSQILRIANSSYFNYPREIYSLERAIVILGFNLLRDIAASIAIYSFYKGLKNIKTLDVKYLWRHSLLTAFIGKTLAEKYDTPNMDLFYVAGLLHDIGKLIMNQVVQEDFYFLQEKSKQEGLRLDIVERRFLGFHHGDVGARLMQNWNLPEKLVHMINFHHNPEEFSGDPEVNRTVRYVYLSNHLAHYIQDNMESMESLIQRDPSFPKFFSFTPENFEELLTEARSVIEEYSGFFDMLQI